MRRPPESALRGTRALLALILAAFLATAAACSRDPHQRLLGDVYGLIDEFYLTSTTPEELTADALEGLERSLAAKAYREKLEKEAEAKKAAESDAKPEGESASAESASDVKPDEKGAPPTPESAPVASPTPEPEPHAALPDGAGLEPTEGVPEGQLDPFALPADENGELPPGPLKVEIADGTATLSIDGVSTNIPLPHDRGAAVDAFLQGYEFVRGRVPDGDPEEDLFNEALEYMTYQLDPHSQFMPGLQYQRLRNETQGHFGGVGIEVGMRSDLLTVIAPIPGTPAAEAGLLPMDRIVKVDGTDTLGLSLIEAVDLIRGEIGTEVLLTIRRGEQPTFDVKLVRNDIPVNSIKTEVFDDGTALVRLFSFNQNTAEDLSKALDELDALKPPVRGVILDMRNNPGGLLDQAVAVADQFLPSGMIVNTIGRGRMRETEKFATRPGTRENIPLVVLINSVSASASEIVAGALQDHRRALILGTRSFGKGSVQSIFTLNENSGLRLTTALYYTPSGRSIQAEGIVPDVRVRLSPEEERMLAEFWSESALSGHLKSQATSEGSSRVVVDAQKMRDHFLASGAIVEDEDYPEKGDWLLVFARRIMSGPDLSIDGMIAKADTIVAGL